MRKLYYLGIAMVLAFTMLMTSCKKDDPVIPDGTDTSDEQHDLAQLILGTWDIDVNVSTMHEEEAFNGETVIEDYTLLEEGMVECQFIFREGGKMTMITVYDENGQIQRYADELNYDIVDNTIVLDGSETMVVTSIEGSRMILDEHQTTTYSDGVYSWDMHLVCDKQ